MRSSPHLPLVSSIDMIGAPTLFAVLASISLIEAIPTQKVFSNVGPIVNEIEPLKREFHSPRHSSNTVSILNKFIQC